MDEAIILNECQNNGSIIHIYYNPVAEAWFSYGISAFLLKELCSSNGIMAIESYSKELQMPSAFILDIIDIVKLSIVIRTVDSYYALSVDYELNDSEYLSWASGLRNTFN